MSLIELKSLASRRHDFRAGVASQLLRQTAGFAASSAIAAALSAIALALLARNLSSSDFGNFAFAVSFLTFGAKFLELGLFTPIALLAARTRGDEQRELLGAGLLLFLPVACLFCVAIVLLSFWVDQVFNVHAGAALRLTAPFAPFYVFGFIGLQLAQGVERIHVYALTSATTQAVFLTSVAFGLFLSADFGVTTALVLRGGALVVGAVLLCVLLRPLFRNARLHVRRIFFQTRAYAFQVYLGRLLGMGTYNMDVLMVAAWTNANQVGLYTLAAALATGVGIPINALSLALFPRMVHERTIDRRWIFLSTLAGVASVIFVWFFQHDLIALLFSSRYAHTGLYVLPLTAAQAVRGITAIYNSFLAAHARGKELRNAALVLTVSNLVLNFALIPPFGALGAAWASLIALVVNLYTHVLFYRRSRAGLST